MSARQIIAMRRGFSAEISNVDVALCITSDGDDLEARHNGAGGIRAVRRDGNQTNIAVMLAALFLVLANDQQPGIFALRTGIRLQGNRRETRDLRQPRFQLLE